ncbi:RagB/SusD family nutrient uptake outer membrane protein [Arcicella rigui]|uniref:RagB/SusD family nutrient uptake outer membrane protein n=1 Tax=Arcicella rigui TaxID=797020 RepID=A0ABU5Q5U1_9BACT|nr:RagB/SusD family nutrient uptake outer membrane protein [Arcicella rigui]MEA5138206.1 RagB/SusD family nutrient uptake outer membrane protein [Arcicella rigui]
MKIISYKKIFALGTLMMFGAACEVTDLQPIDALSETTAYETLERVELAVTGVYDGAQSGFYAGGAVRGYPFGAAHLQQGDCRGEDMVSVAAFYAITYNGTYDATTPNNGFFWQTAYAMINRANVVIDGIRKAPTSTSLTESVKSSYEAELRFLRAMGHFYLLVNFARPYSDNPTAAASGVPYREQPIGTSTGISVDEASKQGRNTVAECYDKILADLDFAEANLPATRSRNAITRATKGAAIALKTRIRLHQNNWAKVIEEANKLIPTTGNLVSPVGNYQLTATPMGPFGTANKNNVESIFSIENNDVDNAGVNGAAPTMYSASISGGRGIVGISPLIWNQPFFPADDFRKSSAMVQQDGATSPGRGAMFSKKYADATSRTDNAPIIRYAEVLLNAAEALARSSSSVDTRALALLNAVRNRAVPEGPGRYTAASFTNGQQLVQAILNERRIEFLAEGMRWLDIHRLGKDTVFGTKGIPAKASQTLTFTNLYTNNPATTYTMLAAIPYESFRFIWPLPIEEINNNPTLKDQQNPGW